jgi:hypothetical protein
MKVIDIVPNHIARKYEGKIIQTGRGFATMIHLLRIKICFVSLVHEVQVQIIPLNGETRFK